MLPIAVSSALVAGALLSSGPLRPFSAESPLVSPQRACVPRAGLFDGLFQETEQQKAIKAQREAQKEADFREQQEMLARRRDPAKMAEYNAQVRLSRCLLAHGKRHCCSDAVGHSHAPVSNCHLAASHGRELFRDDLTLPPRAGRGAPRCRVSEG